ncbi:hypothetical protein B0H63DRAFT_464071 [Podospora didyma]|uniref:F-box domain-containing protein n=1 Tax=Podospora didyma TaxID=330526 RepID=A0AAE0NXI4_9PEZI|nr:hypothetical protein B0H63DRAFT_464071 [Podospora didyma]
MPLFRRLKPVAGPDPAAKPATTPSEDDKQSMVPTADAARRGPASFNTLPPEIHIMISKQLIYPDALSLKHTNRYFYRMVDTGVRLKVDWLVERRRLHLDCPNNQRCELGSDLRFCRGSVSLLMQRRREHIECESRPGLGCLIYGTTTCTHARKLRTRLMKLTIHEDFVCWLIGFQVLMVVPFIAWLVWMSRVHFLTPTD